MKPGSNSLAKWGNFSTTSAKPSARSDMSLGVTRTIACVSAEFRRGRLFPACDGKLLVERPKASPNPIVEVRQALADGTTFKAVWAWLRLSRSAKLVTIHFFES